MAPIWHLKNRWLAWFLAGLIIIIMGAGLALQVAAKSPLAGGPFLIHFSEAAGLGGFAIIGALILSRHLNHPVGWIWLLIAFSFGVDHFAWGYASYGYIAHPGSLPAAELGVIWMYSPGRGSTGLLGLTLLLLLFPNGQFLSRHWKVITWIAVGRIVFSLPVTVLAPSPLGHFPFPLDLLNPNGIELAFLAPLKDMLNIVGIFCVAAGAVSLGLRLKRARGVELQQLKWFAFSASFIPIAFLLIASGGSPLESGYSLLMLSGAMLGVATTLAMAAASAIAIFHYRLYDIDIFIRRSLTYSLLTASLVIVYFSCVVLLTQLFGSVSGQENSPLAIVIATLVIAALFTPLRSRIQQTIDRRFYRRKYDAEKIVAAFGSGLRQDVDIEQLSQRLLALSEETMQPENVSLWIKRQDWSRRS